MALGIGLAGSGLLVFYYIGIMHLFAKQGVSMGFCLSATTCNHKRPWCWLAGFRPPWASSQYIATRILRA